MKNNAKSLTLQFLVILLLVSCIGNDKKLVVGTYILDEVSDSICKSRNQKLLIKDDYTFQLIDRGETISGDWEFPKGAQFVEIDLYDNSEKKLTTAIYGHDGYMTISEPNKLITKYKVRTLIFKKDPPQVDE